MVEPNVSVTALLTANESATISAACKLAGLSLTDWCRHVIFGDVAAPSSPPEDALAGDALVRLGGLVLILQDRLVRSDDDISVHHLLADFAVALLDAERNIAKPYALTVQPMAGIGAGIGTRTKQIKIRCSAGERALVENAAKKLDVSTGAWLGAALLGGGLPGPVRPHSDPAGVVEWDRAIAVVSSWVQCPDLAEAKAGIVQQMAHVIAATRKAARVDLAAETKPICEEGGQEVVL